jgi:shikimate dehydrogenase
LVGWSYTARECAEDQLAHLVAGLGPEWAGLSLTMPLKEVALTVADTVDSTAAALGAANTLVRRNDGWHAVNTDAPGIVGALRAAGAGEVRRVAVLGAGGTARAALGAAALLGAEVIVYARRQEAIDALRRLAEDLGLGASGAPWSATFGGIDADVVISTVPRGVADGLAGLPWTAETVVFDVVYDPWPTPIAKAASAAGATVVSGLDLLLAQALDQFELYTGAPAPVRAMALALTEATGQRLHRR